MSEISNTAVEPYIISSENVPRISEWLFTRGGIAIWNSVHLSDPGFSLTTPMLTAEGQPTPKPNWKVADEPARIITDSAEIVVSTDKEVKHFRVAIRPSGNGLALKVSDGGPRRIRSAVSKAGDGAFHRFDYSTQEAIIFKPSELVSLNEWRQS